MTKTFAIIISLLLLTSCVHSEKKVSDVVENKLVAIDYSDTDFWYSCGDTLMPADIFYVYPTVATVSFADNDSSWYDDITRADVREQSSHNQRFNKMLFTEYNFYAPYYRQLIFEAFRQPDSCVSVLLEVPIADVEAAFQYYMEHYNQGRPYFLMGHSQGSIMLVELLKHGMTDAQRKLMVAAYCSGWKITEEELAAYPEKLVPATDSCGTGTLILFNSVTDMKGVSPLFENTVVGINPLSWTTDTCFAGKEAHLGMARYNTTRDSIVLHPGITGGRLQDNMMVCTDLDSTFSYVPAYKDLFPVGNLHFSESWLFAGNLKQNMARRLRGWKANAE